MAAPGTTKYWTAPTGRLDGRRRGWMFGDEGADRVRGGADNDELNGGKGVWAGEDVATALTNSTIRNMHHPDRQLYVGIDEAGYGPNLGPLVIVAVGIEVPGDVSPRGLWERLSPTVRMQSDACPDCIVVDDSKKVYTSAGLRGLERFTLSLLGEFGLVESLRQIWLRHSLTPLSDLDELPWHADFDRRLPIAIEAAVADACRNQFRGALARADIRVAFVHCQIVMPRRFNDEVRRWGNKSRALFTWNAELLQRVWQRGSRATRVVLDKHGGRHFYRTLLQEAFADVLVLCARESAESSHYVMESSGRRMDVTFQPKADGEFLPVAAASMLAKYLREACMESLNVFFAARVPGLQRTAGYPNDARRFCRAIEPVLRDLKLEPATYWRTK